MKDVTIVFHLILDACNGSHFMSISVTNGLINERE